LSEDKPLRIIGVGNPLLGDDGLGIVAAERLAAMDWPAGVEVLDGGTGGLTLLDLFSGARAVILLDAVAMGAAPGTLRRFTTEDLARLPAAAPGLSLHGGGLAEVLAIARELGSLPPLLLFGVEPERVELGLGLSPAVAAALEDLLVAVRGEVGVWLTETGSFS
jgi:hydrogenase maturation protease